MSGIMSRFCFGSMGDKDATNIKLGQKAYSLLSDCVKPDSKLLTPLAVLFEAQDILADGDRRSFNREKKHALAWVLGHRAALRGLPAAATPIDFEYKPIFGFGYLDGLRDVQNQSFTIPDWISAHFPDYEDCRYIQE
jgi:hypothetical protein